MGRATHGRNESYFRAHFESSDLGALPLVMVTPARIEAFLQGKAGYLAPASLNHLRAYISRAFNAANEWDATVAQILSPKYKSETSLRESLTTFALMKSPVCSMP